MKVLVVDDSPDAAEPLIAFLHLCGHQTSLAHNAADALQLAATFQPAFALLDIGLPGVDGWVLGELMRGLPGLADLPIVAVTGYSSPGDRRRSTEANFLHHLVKPIDYTMLGALLKAHGPASDAPAPAVPGRASFVTPPVVAPIPSDVLEPPATPDTSDR